MDSEPIMLLKPPYTMHLGRYLYRKPPTNFSDEANVLWAKAYGLCQGQQFSDYVARLAQRSAFAKAYADMGGFTLAPPGGKGKDLRGKFTG